MARPPTKSIPVYNQWLDGVFGEFGSGSGLQAFYLQTAITPNDLDKISLISDIPGSESWGVRDLFQRNVDQLRVTESLLPYLQKPEKIKFFNPLTLTVLPMDQHQSEVSKDLTSVEPKLLTDDGSEWDALEREPFFRMRWIQDFQQYAKFEWNDSRSRLVAIDGQHRLFALKCMKDQISAGAEFENFHQWRIPVVIVSFRVTKDRKDPPTVLEVVRNIFMYINSTAREVNKERRILLSDESVNAIATQELLDYSHSNDLKQLRDRDESRIPLLAFDWRGEEVDGKRVSAPTALKSITEIFDWFENYILGDDFSVKQRTTLGITPESSDELNQCFFARHLTHNHSQLVRTRIADTILPALINVLEKFRPYADYIQDLRNLERTVHSESGISRHAFEELRFGSNRGQVTLQLEVQNELKLMIDKIAELKDSHLKSPMNEDIGMRGVIWAFSQFPQHLNYPDWLPYSNWFIEALNAAYDDKWMSRANRTKGKKHLLHVIEDHSDTIVNYRISDAEKAFGPYVALLVGTYAIPETADGDDEWNEISDGFYETLRDTLFRAYKKQYRPEFKQMYPQGGTELEEPLIERSQEEARNRIDNLKKDLKKHRLENFQSTEVTLHKLIK